MPGDEGGRLHREGGRGVKMWSAEGNLCVSSVCGSPEQAVRCVGADLSLESWGKAQKS